MSALNTINFPPVSNTFYPELSSYFFDNLITSLQNEYEIKLLEDKFDDITGDWSIFTLDLGEKFDMTERSSHCANRIKDLISNQMEIELFNNKKNLENLYVNTESLNRIKKELVNNLNNFKLTMADKGVTINLGTENEWVIYSSIFFTTILGLDNDSFESHEVFIYIREYIIFLMLTCPYDHPLILARNDDRNDDTYLLMLETVDEVLEIITGLDIERGRKILNILLETRELIMGSKNCCSCIKLLDKKIDLLGVSRIV